MSYKVCCILKDSCRTETTSECPSYHEAVACFLFYVHLSMVDSLSFECVKILQGQKCIQKYQNLKPKNDLKKGYKND